MKVALPMEEPKIDIKIRRDLNPDLLFPMTEAQASSEDGLFINHNYYDIRGCDLEDLNNALAEEKEFFEEWMKVRNDIDALNDLIDEYTVGEMGFTGLDPGIVSAVIALSVLGAAPITSCNGGLLGEREHVSDVPHVIFSAEKEIVKPILEAASIAGCGLINNDHHAELYADRLSAMRVFALQVASSLRR